MNDGLPDHYRSAIFSVLQQFPEIVRVFVFGSRAKGRYHKASDIDLVFDTVDGKPLHDARLVELLDALEELYIPINIDLKDRAKIASRRFAEVVQRDGVLWWEAEKAAGKGMLGQP